MSREQGHADGENRGKLADRETRRPWRPRFGMGCIMLVMLVCSVIAASAYYMVRGSRGDRSSFLIFLLFTIAAPPLLMGAVSLLRELAIRMNRR